LARSRRGTRRRARCAPPKNPPMRAWSTMAVAPGANTGRVKSKAPASTMISHPKSFVPRGMEKPAACTAQP